MSSPKKILIFTYGSRGDVEPFIALSKGLENRGYAVTLSSAERYGEWVKTFGLAFQPLSNAVIDLIDTPDGKTALEGASGIFKRIAAGLRLARKSATVNADLSDDAWRAAQEVQPDLIIYHPKVIAAPHIAEAMGVPAILGLLQPLIVPTSAFPAAGKPDLPIPGYNRVSYCLVHLSYGSFRKSINALRTRDLGLRPIRRGREVMSPKTAPVAKMLHAISPSVLPRPQDWLKKAVMTGYWALAPDPEYRPPQKLSRFIEAGPPPVYIGFGSMTVENPSAFLQVLIDALRKAGVRGVISAGWAGFDQVETQDVLTVGSVPHTWLFPKMAAVVHHGGMGTTAQGFRSGVPCVICPFFGDQPYWAKIGVSLGVSAPPVPRSKLTSERLAVSILTALNNTSLRENALLLAGKLSGEDGVATAVAEIEGVRPLKHTDGT